MRGGHFGMNIWLFCGSSISPLRMNICSRSWINMRLRWSRGGVRHSFLQPFGPAGAGTFPAFVLQTCGPAGAGRFAAWFYKYAASLGTGTLAAWFYKYAAPLEQR